MQEKIVYEIQHDRKTGIWNRMIDNHMISSHKRSFLLYMRFIMCAQKSCSIILFCVSLLLHPQIGWEVFAHEDISSAPSHSRQIIIDTDMGLDDVRALFAFFGSTDIKIRGIISVEGSAAIGKGLDNLIGMVEASHRETIPIFQGYAFQDGQIPPWRETANQLGGYPFPPPKTGGRSRHTMDALISLLTDHQSSIDYCALGPLTNLAHLDQAHPGILKNLHAVWLPARISTSGEVRGWNFTYDRSSSKIVFENASNIILIDTSEGARINPCRRFSSISGSSYPAAWIAKFLSDQCAENEHLVVSDELAAASLIAPETITISDERYYADISDTVRIIPDKQGNIRVAKIEQLDSAVELLKNLWSISLEARSMQHEHQPDDPIPTQDLLKRFHGHLGPYVVLGYRMGRLALKLTGSEGHFNISVEVYSILKPPQSCLIDGIQLGSGCTLGKRNIDIHETAKPAYAIFTIKDGMRVTIKLRDEVPSMVATLIDEKGVEAAGQILLEKEIGMLFETEIDSSPGFKNQEEKEGEKK